MGLLTEQAQLLKQIAEGFSAGRYGHDDLHKTMAAFAETASTAFDALEQRVVAMETKKTPTPPQSKKAPAAPAEDPQ